MIKAIALSTVVAVVSVVSFAGPVGASKIQAKSAKSSPIQGIKAQSICNSPACGK